MAQFLSFVMLSCLLTFVECHPSFQAEFNRIIDSSPCLTRCMDAFKSTELDLSLAKTVHYGRFVDNLDKICDVIAAARDCIAECKGTSNPFELSSVTVVCAPEIRARAHKYVECIAATNDAIESTCTAACGNYDEISYEIVEMTNVLNGKTDDQEKVGAIMAKTNDGCGSMKCHARCSVATYAQQCGADSGYFLRGLIETVLRAQRKDLDERNLTNTMMRSVPSQCTYMYMPEVMFNVTKDQLAQEAIDDIVRGQAQQKNVKIGYEEALAVMQKHVMARELQVLDKQEQNLEKESLKLDMEIALLKKKAFFA